jgi:orotidine-5'-phosphate decarboxylase
MNRQKLIENISKKRSFLCVGLDSDPLKLPECVMSQAQSPAQAMLEFNKKIIDAVAPYCVAFKPNTAFYEALGSEGWDALQATVEYIRTNHPDQFIIADAKRGDIGNTSALYARAFFEKMDVDALTVAPYMGSDSVKPFLGYKDKWVILLALTSNPGSRDFQLLNISPEVRTFEQVITTAQLWGGADEMMFVVGATQGDMFADIRKVAPHHFLLVPGVGAQGGDLATVCRYGMTKECGLLVNSSRGIIFASKNSDYADAAASAAQTLAQEMAEMLAKYSII